MASAAAGHKSGTRPEDTANRTLHLCFFREESDNAAASDPRRPVVTSGTGIVRRYQASPLSTDTTPQNSPLLHLIPGVGQIKTQRRGQDVLFIELRIKTTGQALGPVLYV